MSGMFRSSTSPQGPKSRGVPPPTCGFHMPALRTRRQRPSRRAAEKRDELAPVAVEMRVTSHPPHRSVRAAFPHSGFRFLYRRDLSAAACEPATATRLRGGELGATDAG